jgi:hypothetical protein
VVDNAGVPSCDRQAKLIHGTNQGRDALIGHELSGSKIEIGSTRGRCSRLKTDTQRTFHSLLIINEICLVFYEIFS